MSFILKGLIIAFVSWVQECAPHTRDLQSHSSFFFREQNVSSQIHSRILVRNPRRFLRPPEPQISASDQRRRRPHGSCSIQPQNLRLLRCFLQRHFQGSRSGSVWVLDLRGYG